MYIGYFEEDVLFTYDTLQSVWNPLRLRKNGYVFIKYHTKIVRLLQNILFIN